MDQRNGLITSYTLNISETGGSGAPIQRTVPGTQTSITISSLTPFTNYFCLIAASTSAGRGPFSTILNLNTPEDGKKTKLASTHSSSLYNLYTH